MSFADIASTTNKKAETFGFTETERKRILQAAHSLPAPTTSSESEILRKLEQLKRRDTAWALHSSSLAEYARAQRIPRGLRVTLKPALFRDDEDFKQKWRGILNRCSLDLIALTIQQLHIASKDLKQQIHVLEEEYAAVPEVASNTALQELEQRIESLKQEILQVKLRKYRRDTYDYERGEVYTWMDARRLHRQQRTSSAARSERSPAQSAASEQESPLSTQSSAGSSPVPFLSWGHRKGSVRFEGGKGEARYKPPYKQRGQRYQHR
ncbi:hypothetical protein XELAEV_18020483mg [Xenopus laevis]|uniref:Uncharacterized protein n=1 Tax=Xenopus laevis TaxID=8355 RepID=A0A974HQN7_XENLA|nr:hypothetical protein XELAEV_18020483mg [Xenopus laevis]